ncbi:outer membrane protein [Candidatus Vecturithrix granuli]|uniref:Outer membrane protein n=1 Tax=Vecturithrix granuli TaxID=1499967 RepID=A0A081BX45_VECG1|nr:outer membrane protein [Candidatus Vecturithrix granuli]
MGKYTATRIGIDVAGILLLILIMSGCTQTSDLTQRIMGRDIAAQRGAEGEGWCPSITVFTVTPLTAKCGDPVSLELAATAPQSDQLSYLWEIEGQSFETGHRAVWHTPTCQTIEDPEKVYTVRGVVTDGECSVTRSVEVKVLCNCALDTMVHFEFAKANLDATAKTELDGIAEKVLQNPEYSVLIEGHTDYIGNEQNNERLGKRRAEAVKNYLIKTWQIDADRLITRSYGEKQPIAPNETTEGRAKNRRAEVFRIILTTR